MWLCRKSAIRNTKNRKLSATEPYMNYVLDHLYHIALAASLFFRQFSQLNPSRFTPAPICCPEAQVTSPSSFQLSQAWYTAANTDWYIYAWNLALNERRHFIDMLIIMPAGFGNKANAPIYADLSPWGTELELQSVTY